MPETMYRCTECEHTFHTPKKYKEPDGLETPPFRYSLGCPHCGGSYEPIIATCTDCGYGICEGDRYYIISSTGEYFCEQCIEERR